MKKWLVVLAFLAMVVPAYAAGGNGGNNCNGNGSCATYNDVTNQGGKAEVDVVNLNVVDQKQGQQQGQIQGQKQSQGQSQAVIDSGNATQGQNQFGYVENNTSIQVDAAPNKWSRQHVGIPEIVPQAVTLLPGGVKDVTKLFPFVGIKAYQGEEVVGVIVEDGNFLIRNRVEDVIEVLLKQKDKALERGWKLSLVRVQVISRDSSSGFGVGGGLQAGGSALDGGSGTAGMASSSILPSYGRSTSDPRLTVFVYYLKDAAPIQ